MGFRTRAISYITQVFRIFQFSGVMMALFPESASHLDTKGSRDPALGEF